ncbi:unnamed protein product [Prunus armeniaca]|uniref:Uncharacterized protein n=1 Tax=Prunus armeniaca TaxID=36596 RepID=A0A6J5XKZ8_PRUAR|nr:unnamed protein product [Prunus armeniaca]
MTKGFFVFSSFLATHVISPTLPLVTTDTRSSPSPESSRISKAVIKFRKRLVSYTSAGFIMISEDNNRDAEVSGAVDTNIPENEQQVTTEITESKETKSPVQKSRGGWTLATILLANQGLATLAFFGVGVNLVLFLIRVLDQQNAAAANNVSKWTGTVYLFSLVGAFLSDSYWGRFLTCAIFQLILVLGLGLLSLSSWLYLIHPSGCGDGVTPCKPKSTAGVVIFYLSIYLIALGYGGHQPTIATFGADQFDETNPKQQSSKAAFFCYFYFALNVGSLFSNSILVYYEDKGFWTMGFLVSLGSAIVGLVSYLLAAPRYRYIKPSGNPLPRVAQVFVAAFRKWKVVPASPENLYEVEGSESAIKGSRKILHSKEIVFLDKAATITEMDRSGPNNPWRVCTVTQVEEAKCVLKMLPIWLCTIIYSVVFTQMASLFVEQAASMSLFDIFSVLICTGIYRQIVVPVSGRLSGNPKGLSELQRMGIGLIIGLLSMVAAGATEVARLKHVQPGQKFFNGQAPDGIKSLGSSLCMASISLGNYVSSLLVTIVMMITARVYVFCAKRYKGINLQEPEQEMESIEAPQEEVGINRV